MLTRGLILSQTSIKGNVEVLIKYFYFKGLVWKTNRRFAEQIIIYSASSDNLRRLNTRVRGSGARERDEREERKPFEINL